MLKKIVILSLFLSASLPASAECDFKKAARNKVLDDKIGISGKCNTEKAARQKVLSGADELLNTDIKEMQRQTESGREQVKDKIDEIKKIPDVSIKGAAGSVKK
ncbi:hypothetical protein L9G70_12620 [Morganella morganii]|uniref:hypothetical protein n=1 Tax=Morganella morganii TaxID=582 RepID=UPI00339C0DDF